MAAHRNPVKRQQKRFPTRPFFLTGVWNSSYCLQKPAFILSPVLPDQFLFRLLLKMLRQWFCFFLFLPNQRGIIPHCVIRAASPIEQVFFPGQVSPSFHISVLCISNVSFCRLFFPCRYGETHRISPHICGFYRIPSIPSIKTLMVWITTFCSFGRRFRTREIILWVGFFFTPGFLPNN